MHRRKRLSIIDSCRLLLAPCWAYRAHSQSSASQGGRVLPIRWLSRPLRWKGWRRAQTSSGGALRSAITPVAT